ncbi:MAG: O-antigen ligase family protein [Candidatus Sedimenticola sp. (ex Thyasira tokunagai)]
MISVTLNGTVVYFLVLMTSVPLLNNGSGHAYDQKRIIELLILLLALLANASASYEEKRSTVVEKTIVLIILLGLFSALLAPVPIYAFIELSLFIGLWCTAIHFKGVTISLKENSAALLFSTLTLVAATIYLSSFYVGYIAALIEDYPIEWWHLFRGFDNIRFFNQVQIWTLPLLTLLFISKPFPSYLPQKVVAFVVSSWWMLLFFSAGRGAMLATFAGAITVGIIYRSSAITFIKTHLLFAMSGFLLFQLLAAIPLLTVYDLPSLPEVLRLEANTRIILWKQAIQLITDNPIFGVGPMHYAWYPNLIAAHPHNSILQWAVEWGLPSLILLGFLFTYGAYHWLRHFSPAVISQLPGIDRNIVIGLSCSLLSGLGYSLVSGVIVMPMSQIVMVVVIGLMMGVYKNSEDTEPRTVARRVNILWRTLYASTFVLLLTSVWPSLIEHLDSEVHADTSNIQTVGPRFWRIGGIPHNQGKAP